MTTMWEPLLWQMGNSSQQVGMKCIILRTFKTVSARLFWSCTFMSVHINSLKSSIWFSAVTYIDVLALLSEIHRKSKAWKYINSLFITNKCT
jgi:hypothetical protein